MPVTRQRVIDALDSVPATDGVLVVQAQEDGTLKKLAERDPAPNHPGRIIVLNSKQDAAARLSAGRVSRPSQPVEPASPGDTPTSDEQPRDRPE